MTLWPYRPYYVLWQIYCIVWLFRYYFQIAILLDQPPTDQPSYGILTIQLAVLPTWLTAYGILISHSQFAVLPHQQTDRLWHFVPPNPNCHIFFCPAQICSPGCMAFHFQFLICCTSDHQLPADQQQTDWATAFQFQFSVCRTFFWPDQDLIPCPRLDFLLWHFVFNFNLPYPFLARPRLDSLFPALISCYGISVSISKLPYSGPRLLFSLFMALPHLLCSVILPRYFDLYLWARNKFMVLASCSDTSQDYSFGRLETPSTITLAFEQLGLIPAKVWSPKQ